MNTKNSFIILGSFMFVIGLLFGFGFGDKIGGKAEAVVAAVPVTPFAGVNNLTIAGLRTKFLLLRSTDTLTAAAVKILGGEVLCRFVRKDEADEQAIREAGIKDIKQVFRAEDLARGQQLTFTATGVIDGPILKGVLFRSHDIVTHSMVLRGTSGTLRYVTAHHAVAQSTP